MAWTPTNTALGSIDENTAISYTPTYIDDIDLTSLLVTITATESHPTIAVGTSISGYYANSFDYGITYKNIPSLSFLSQSIGKEILFFL